MNPWESPHELTIPGKSGPIVLDLRAWYGPADTGLDFAIVLLREDQLAQVLDGTELWSRSGARVVVGIDEISSETRYGFIGYGVRVGGEP